MVCGCRLVYGTQFGPDETGQGKRNASPGLFVSGFLAAPIACVLSFGRVVWGVWFGVVV